MIHGDVRRLPEITLIFARTDNVLLKLKCKLININKKNESKSNCWLVNNIAIFQMSDLDVRIIRKQKRQTLQTNHNRYYYSIDRMHVKTINNHLGLETDLWWNNSYKSTNWWRFSYGFMKRVSQSKMPVEKKLSSCTERRKDSSSSGWPCAQWWRRTSIKMVSDGSNIVKNCEI